MLAEEWVSARASWWGASAGDGKWKTVRVFISSTFGDMMGERDALTRNVFPQLNSMIKSRRVRCLPVDLRWGLSSLDTSDEGLGALEHCLLEIEASRPFFLYLAGDRYGWTPPSYRVSDDPRFAWCKTFEAGHSITDLEVQSGFLRKAYTPVHAWMYRRRPDFLVDVRDEDEQRMFQFDYAQDGPEDRMQRALWKDIHDHPFAKTRDYSCVYGGKDEEGKPHVRGLEQFERDVLHDIYESICMEFPPPPPPPSPLHVERAFHDHFVQQRAASFIGRQGIIDVLTAHANGDCSGSSLPFVVVGAPGSGKTSLVCKFAKQYSEAVGPAAATLVVHIVSASPTSTEIREVLLRLCHELVECLQLDWDQANDSADYQTVKELFAETLKVAGREALSRHARVLVVMDAINQLNPYNGAHMVDWFPLFAPPGVRAVLSTTPDSAALTALQRRDPPPKQLTVPGLSEPERREIVVTQLREYRKKLLPYQLDLVLAKQDSFKPLYLLTLCEELRLQAQYGRDGTGVDDKIREMPAQVRALMDEVLKRIERDIATWARTSGSALVGMRVPRAPNVGTPRQTASEFGDDDARSAGGSGSQAEWWSANASVATGTGNSDGGRRKPMTMAASAAAAGGVGAGSGGSAIGDPKGRRGSVASSIASRRTPRVNSGKAFTALRIEEGAAEDDQSVHIQSPAGDADARMPVARGAAADLAGRTESAQSGSAGGSRAGSTPAAQGGVDDEDGEGSEGGPEGTDAGSGTLAGRQTATPQLNDGDEETNLMALGRRLVRDALTLLECSRHGLSESELLELLAPPGRERLPPVAWARLYRTLEVYLRPQDEGGEGIIGFFHQQIRFAVRRRYLSHSRDAEPRVMERLAHYCEAKADPTGDGRWLGKSQRQFDDLVFYQLGAHDYQGLQRTLGNIRFIEAKVAFGGATAEHLLRDYFQAQDCLRTVKFSLLRDRLAGAPLRQRKSQPSSPRGARTSPVATSARGGGTSGGFSVASGPMSAAGTGSSVLDLVPSSPGSRLAPRSGNQASPRTASSNGSGKHLLAALSDATSGGQGGPPLVRLSRTGVVSHYDSFRVFVSGHQALLAAFARLTLQFALSQPDDTAPHVAAAAVVESHLRSLTLEMETREKSARDRAAFEVRRLRKAEWLAQRIALHVRDDLRVWAAAGFAPAQVSAMASADAIAADELGQGLEGWEALGAVRKPDALSSGSPFSPAPLAAAAAEADPWVVAAAAARVAKLAQQARDRVAVPNRPPRLGQTSVSAAGPASRRSSSRSISATPRSSSSSTSKRSSSGGVGGPALPTRGRRRASVVLPGAVPVSRAAAAGMLAAGLHPCWPVTAATAAALELMPVAVANLEQALCRLRWELSRASDGLTMRNMSRRYCEFVNKPRHNRIVADFAGFSSEITTLAMPSLGSIARAGAAVPSTPTADGEAGANTGMIIAIGFKDGAVQLVDAATGETKSELRVGGHSAPVSALVFSGDGQRLASGGNDSRVVIWDVGGQSKLADVSEHTAAVTSALWIEARAHRPAAGHARHSSSRHSARSGGSRRGPRSVSRRKRGALGGRASRILLTSSMDRSLCLSQEVAGSRSMAASKAGPETRYELLRRIKMNSNPVLCLAFSQATLTVAAGHMDGRVSIFDASAPTLGLVPLQSWAANRLAGVVRLQYSTDGSVLATGGLDGKIRLFSSRGEGEGSTSGDEASATGGRGHARSSTAGAALARGAAGRAAAAAMLRAPSDAEEEEDAAADVVWHERPMKWQAPSSLSGLHFSEDGKRLAVSCLERKATVLRVSDGAEELALTGHASSVTAALFWPGSNDRLVTASKDKTVKCWDAGGVTSQGVGQLAVRKATPETIALDTMRAVAAAYVSAMSPERLGTSRGASQRSRRFVLPDAHSDDSGSAGAGSVSAARVGPAPSVTSPLTSTPGSVVPMSVAAAAATVTSSRTATRAPRGGHAVRVTAACVCPDGSLRAVTGDADGDIKVWDGASGDELAVLLGHAAAISVLHWTRNGATLVSADAGGTCFIWDGLRLTHKVIVPVAIGVAITSVTTSTFPTSLVEGLPHPPPSRSAERERNRQREMARRERARAAGLSSDSDSASSVSTGDEGKSSSKKGHKHSSHRSFRLTGAAAAVLSLTGPIPGTAKTKDQERADARAARRHRREERSRLRERKVMVIVGLADGRVVGFDPSNGMPWTRLIDAVGVLQQGAGDGARDSPMRGVSRRAGRRASTGMAQTSPEASTAVCALRIVGLSRGAVPSSSLPAPLCSGTIGSPVPPPPGMADDPSASSSVQGSKGRGPPAGVGGKGGLGLRSNGSVAALGGVTAGRTTSSRASIASARSGSGGAPKRRGGPRTSDADDTDGPASAGRSVSADVGARRSSDADARASMAPASWLEYTSTEDPPEQVRGITPMNRVSRLLILTRCGSLAVLQLSSMAVVHKETMSEDAGPLGKAVASLADADISPDASRVAMAPHNPLGESLGLGEGSLTHVPRLVVGPAASLFRSERAPVRPPVATLDEDDLAGARAAAEADELAGRLPLGGGKRLSTATGADAGSALGGGAASVAAGEPKAKGATLADAGKPAAAAGDSDAKAAADESKNEESSEQRPPEPWVSKLSFSLDGTLLAAGLRSREVVVIDPARPGMGPVFEFVTVGAVSAVAAGHGVMPWPDPEPADDDDDDDDDGGGGNAGGGEVGDTEDRAVVMRRLRAKHQRRASIGSTGASGPAVDRASVKSTRGRRGSGLALVESGSAASGRGHPSAPLHRMGVSGRIAGPEDTGTLVNLEAVAAAAEEPPQSDDETPDDIARDMAAADAAVAVTAGGAGAQDGSGGRRAHRKKSSKGLLRDAAQEHRLRDLELSGVGLSEQRLLAGDGEGRMGIVVAGDATGQVFIIALVDVLRVAEARRLKDAVASQQEARRKAREERAEAETRRRDAEEAERRRRLESIRHAPPAEALRFADNRVACAILPPRRLRPSEARDRQLFAECMAMLGMDAGLLPSYEVARVREALPDGGDVGGCWAMLRAAERRAMALVAFRAQERAAGEADADASSASLALATSDISARVSAEAVGGPLTVCEGPALEGMETLVGLIERLAASPVAFAGVKRPSKRGSSGGRTGRLSGTRMGVLAAGSAGSRFVVAAGAGSGAGEMSQSQVPSRPPTGPSAAPDLGDGMAAFDAATQSALTVITRGMSPVDVAAVALEVVASGQEGPMPPLTVWEASAAAECFGVPLGDMGVSLRSAVALAGMWRGAAAALIGVDCPSREWSSPIDDGDMPAELATTRREATAAPGSAAGSSPAVPVPIHVFVPSLLRGAAPLPSPFSAESCAAQASHFGDLPDEPPPTAKDKPRPESPAAVPTPKKPVKKAGSRYAPHPPIVAKPRTKVVVAFGRVISSPNGRPPTAGSGLVGPGSPAAGQRAMSGPPRPVVDPRELALARQALFRSRFFSRPRALLCVFGGAGGLHDLLVPELRSIIRRGAVTAAIATGAMLLDGGTKAGVMDMVGKAMVGRPAGCLRALGVAPDGVVDKPQVVGSTEAEAAKAEEESKAAVAAAAAAKAAAAGEQKSDADRKALEERSILERLLGERRRKKKVEEEEAAKAARAPTLWKCDLEPNHPSFLLTPSSEWGSETSTMATGIAVLRHKLPTVAVLANGGLIAKQEALTVVRSRVPLIVLAGSGRLADTIAKHAIARAQVEGHRLSSLADCTQDASRVAAQAEMAAAAAGSDRDAAAGPDPGSLVQKVKGWRDSAEGQRLAEQDPPLAEVAAYGDLHMLSISEPPHVLQDLIIALVDRERRRELAAVGRWQESGMRGSGKDKEVARRVAWQSLPVPLLVCAGAASGMEPGSSGVGGGERWRVHDRYGGGASAGETDAGEAAAGAAAAAGGEEGEDEDEEDEDEEDEEDDEEGEEGDGEQSEKDEIVVHRSGSDEP